MSKKVLIVIPSLEQGGAEKFVVDLASKMDKDRFTVRLLVYYRYTDSVFDIAAKQCGIDVHYLDKHVGLDISFFKQVKKAVVDYAPDIIHTNLDSMLYLFPCYRRKQVKLHTVHNIAETESAGLQRVVRNIAYKLFAVKPVGICDTVADSIAQVHRLKRNSIPVVYNGVDCARYRTPMSQQEKLNFVNVGSMHSVKNLSFLIECFSQIHEEFPATHLTLVGDGVLRHELEQQIHDLGLGDSVTITGVVSNVEDYLATADIYVASSIYEGLPISILEALSAGVPVISTKVGGVPDIIDDKNGMLVELGDKNGYIKAMRAMITDKEKRQKLAEGALACSSKYDISLMVEQYETLYDM